MNVSLRTRIFIGIVFFAGVSLALVWFVVRPQYEQRVLNERFAVVQQLQSYTVESLEKQLDMWLTTTEGITLQLIERPKEGETFVHHTMILHPEIVRIRIHSPELPDELVSQNTLYAVPSFPQSDSAFIPAKDSLLFLGWSRESDQSLVVTRAAFRLNNAQFFTTVWWDATPLNALLHQLPFGVEHAVLLLPEVKDSLVQPFYANCDPAFGRKITQGKHISRFTAFSHNGRQWYGVGAAFQKAPLKLVIALPLDVVLAPVHELVSATILFLGILFLLLLIAGWILAHQISKPIRRLMADVARLSELDFSQPIHQSGMHDIQRMAETIEHMRRALERYKRLNVEKIIVEEWKNKLFMMHSDDLIAVTDPDGTFIFRNTRFEDFCSQLSPSASLASKEAFLSLPALKRSKETVREETTENTTVQNTTLELKVQLPDDEVRYFRMSDSTISTEGQILGSLIILHDLTNDRLVDKMKNDMMNVIVHELRSPVGSIIGFADILLRQNDVTPEEQKEFLGYILEGGNRLLALIHRFLDISRLDSRRVEYPKQPTDIQEIITNVVEHLQPQLRAKDLAIEINVEENIPMLIASPDLLREAVMNLVTNAIKYGDPHRTIRIHLTKNNDSVVFSITDYGYGIPLEAQEKLFSKFYRVHSNKKAQQQTGTGLGLAYVKEIVTYHNGSITVESTPEIGCRFTISLPWEGNDNRDGNH